MFMFIMNSGFIYHYYYHSSSLILSIDVDHPDSTCFWFSVWNPSSFSSLYQIWPSVVKFITHHHSLLITCYDCNSVIVNSHRPSQPEPWRYQYSFLFQFSFLFDVLLFWFPPVFLLFDFDFHGHLFILWLFTYTNFLWYLWSFWVVIIIILLMYIFFMIGFTSIFILALLHQVEIQTLSPILSIWNSFRFAMILELVLRLYQCVMKIS